MILIKWIKQYWKYPLIVIINAFILFTISVFLVDKVEFGIDEISLPFTVCKIVGVSLLSLTGILIAIFLISKGYIKKEPKRKILLSIIFTFVLSSSLYFENIKTIYSSLIGEGEYQLSTFSIKTRVPNILLGQNFKVCEYNFYRITQGFPEISKNASNISFRFTYEFLIPDYGLTVKYEIPKNELVEEIFIEEDRFLMTQKFTIIGDKKVVEFSESTW